MSNLHPNIIFLVIDSFRADKFSGTQNSSKTPTIDKLVKDGTYFSHAVSSADGTILSLNTLFTGLFSHETGNRAIKLSLQFPNFLHELQKNEYHIYGLTPDLFSLQPLIELFENNFSTYKGDIPIDHLFDGVGSKLKKILDDKKDEPWFCYAHLMDLHWPLIVPEKFDKKEYGDDKYDRIVSSIDYWLKEFLENIDLKNTFLIITGDHGCVIPFDGKDIANFEPDLNLGLKLGKKIMPKKIHSVGAKFFVTFKNYIRKKRLDNANKGLSNYEIRSRYPNFYMSLYDEVLRIPLLINGPGITSMTNSRQVRTIDIFPTLFDILKISFPTKIQGKSFFNLFTQNDKNTDPCFIHTIPYEKLSKHDLVGLRTPSFKYFRNAKNKNENVHLYDLINDPLENKNIANDEYLKVNEMENILSSITSFTTNTEKENLDDMEEQKIRDELKKLGYL
jgi:arylsulfatase A-like enzyme